MSPIFLAGSHPIELGISLTAQEMGNVMEPIAPVYKNPMIDD